MTVSNVMYSNKITNTKNYVKSHKWQQEDNKELSMMEMIQERMDEIADKVQKGETETKVQIGGQSFSEKEWKRLIQKVDASINKNEDSSDVMKQQLDMERKGDVPYSWLAKNGVIEYKGTAFVCDYEHNALLLGDTSNEKNCIKVSLADGGSLIVNRDNLNQLSGAIDMFSPEDINLILRAITKDNKIQQLKKEIEDEKNSVGTNL